MGEVFPLHHATLLPSTLLSLQKKVRRPYNANTMPRSPFHGIFNTLGEQGENGTSKSGQPLFSSSRFGFSSSKKDNKSQSGQLAVDIFEKDDHIIVRAPIAGIKPSDIDVEVQDNVLTIRGTRRQSEKIEEESFTLQECFWGEFSRSITLPFRIDPKKMKATFDKESVLKVIIPKEEERVKVVRIQGG
jgi:HSP20 family protein